VDPKTRTRVMTAVFVLLVAVVVITSAVRQSSP
jgi:hypothetical protein